MRNDLPRYGSQNSRDVPTHLGLAYDAYAPVDDDGKVPDKQSYNDKFKADWLQRLADISIVDGYATSYARWRACFQTPHDCTTLLTLKSRMLIGHGNSSATEVGLTLHHTWGVPIIPGSALKGLCAHYTAAIYGGNDTDRLPYLGTVWNGTRIEHGPGDVYRNIFGAPDADDQTGASAGCVVFHDALYDPASTTGPHPFAVDVLTVHQRSYYGQLRDEQGAPLKAGDRWPNDYDSPNPIGFLTVKPGAQFLLALSGPPAWTKLAGDLLSEAIATWGIGGKTAAGYGVGEAQWP